MSTEYRHPLIKHFLHAVRTYSSIRPFASRHYYKMAILNPYPTDDEYLHNARLLDKRALRRKA